MGAGGGAYDSRDVYRGHPNRVAVNRVDGANDTELPAYGAYLLACRQHETLTGYTGSESTTTLHMPTQPTATYNPAQPPLGSHPNAASTTSLPVYADAPPKYA